MDGPSSFEQRRDAPAMKPRIIALALAAFAFALPVFADTPSSPYSGQQTRSIKALSDEDIAGLVKGEGLGYGEGRRTQWLPRPEACPDTRQGAKADRRTAAAASGHFRPDERRCPTPRHGTRRA